MRWLLLYLSVGVLFTIAANLVNDHRGDEPTSTAWWVGFCAFTVAFWPLLATIALWMPLVAMVGRRRQ